MLTLTMDYQYRGYSITTEPVQEGQEWLIWAWIKRTLTICKVVGETEQMALARAREWIDNHGLWKE